MRKILYALFIVSLLLSSCRPANAEPAQSAQPVTVQRIRKAEGGTVNSADERVAIEIPPEGLYEDTEISIVEVSSVDRDSDLYELPGAVYAIEAAEGGAFLLPVEITIPYEPQLIPQNRSEDDVFPVVLYNGTWYRAEGYVDKDENTLHAITLHNGEWSWAYDKAGEWTEEIVALFRKRTPPPETLEEAYALLEQREVELQDVWREAQVRVDDTVSLDEVLAFYEDHVRVAVGSTALAVAASSAWIVDLGGKAGIVYVSEIPVGVALTGGTAAGIAAIKWIGFAGGVVLAFKLGRDNLVVLNEIRKLELAHQRYEEAKAIVWALEHPDALTIPPAYQEKLLDYYASLPIDQTVGTPVELDLSVSSIKDPEDLGVEPSSDGTNYSDLATFKQALKEAIESGNYPRLEDLVHEAFEGGYFMSESFVFSKTETMERFKVWEIEAWQVDVSDRGFQVIEQMRGSGIEWPAPVFIAETDDADSIWLLQVVPEAGRYFWKGAMEVSVPLYEEWYGPLPEGSSKQAGESSSGFDLSSYDDCVSAIAWALRNNDPDLFESLLHEPTYIHGCGCPGCGCIVPTARSLDEAKTLFLQMQEFHDLAEIEVTDRKADVGCFVADPVLAQHSVTLPIDYGLCLGIAPVSDRFYITDIWWQVQ